MKVITLRDELPYSVETVWKILSDVTRCDWVPSVDSIVLQDNVRKFKMDGIGEIQEKILINDIVLIKVLQIMNTKINK